MTAVSVLTRVLPFLLEAYMNLETGEVDPDLDRMFWSTKEASPSSGGDEDDDEVGGWCVYVCGCLGV